MSSIYVDLELSHDVQIKYDLGLAERVKKTLDEPITSKLERQMVVQEVTRAVNRWIYECAWGGQ